jgi:amino acid permease
MKVERIKYFIWEIILIVCSILITLGAVIFSQFLYEKQVFYFKIGLGILLVFIIIYVVYSWYTTPDFIQIFTIRMRIKKDIKELKKRNKQRYLKVGDLLFIFNHLDKFKDIKNFNFLMDYVEKQIKELSKYTTETFIDGITKSIKNRLNSTL